MKKRALALVTVLILALTLLAGCGAPAADSGASGVTGDLPKVGVVTPDADHGFTGESVAHARAELEELEAAGEIEYKFGVGGEAAKQIAELEAIIDWGPDVIVLWPLEGDQLRNMATQIMEEDIKLIVYDRLIDDFEPTAEVMGDNETIGEMMGEYLVHHFDEELAEGETINYLRFIGDSSTVSVQRSAGMDNVIEESGAAEQFVQVHEDYQTDWSNETAQEQMENWLTTASDAEIAGLKAIVTHDDEVVDGVVVALENYNNENPDKLEVELITGVGARRETIDTFDNEVANGVELVTYFFSPSMVRDAIRIGVAAAKGEQYDGKDIAGGELFLIPTIEVDENTVEDFRNSDEYAERYSI